MVTARFSLEGQDSLNPEPRYIVHLRKNSLERNQWDHSQESAKVIDEMLIWLPERTLKEILRD